MERVTVKKYYFLFIFFLVLMGLNLFPLVSATNFIYVNPNATPVWPYGTPGSACNTIQDAFNAIADVNEGTSGPTDNDLVTRGNNFLILVQDASPSYVEVAEITNYVTSTTYDIYVKNDTNHSPHVNGQIRVENEWVTIDGLRVEGGAVSDDINGWSAILVNVNNVFIRNCWGYNVNSDNNGDTGIVITATSEGGVFIANNICYGNNSGIRTTGSATVIWSNICYSNRVKANTGSHGIRAGTSGTNCVFAQNRCYGNYRGIEIRGFSDNTRIFNNLCYNNDLDGISVRANSAGNPCTNFRVFQNTVFGNLESGIRIHAENDDVLNVAIFNNLITDNGRYAVEGISGGGNNITYDLGLGGVNYNMSYNNGLGDHNIGANWLAQNTNANPKYINTIQSDPQFLMVSNNSPVIDRGGDSSGYGTWPNDFWGDPRPFDNPYFPNPYSIYDIGADEFYVLVHDLDHFIVSHDTSA
jgi:hypothetical protein